MAEEVLISIKLEKGESEKGIDNLTQSITELTHANADLQKQNNQLIKTGQDNSKQYQENTRQIEINKQKIQQATASRKGLVQAIVSEDNSIKALRAENAELIRQRDVLNTKTEEGRNKIAQINSRIDENNATIKENSSALEKQRLNIGNYASALDRVVPGLSGFVSGIQSAGQAVKGLWIALGPVSIAIAALAVLMAPLVSFLTQTGDGMDLVEKKSTGMKEGFKVLGDEVNKLGRSFIESDNGFSNFIKKIVVGNPIVLSLVATVKLLNAGLNSLTDDGFKNAIAAGEEYAETMDEINTASQFFEANAGEEENAIKRLILQSKNRTLAEEERIELIDEALAKEEKLASKRQDFATSELLAIVQLGRARTGLRQTEEETLTDFANRLAKEFDKTDNDMRDRILENIKQVNEARSASITVEEKLQNQRDALLDKAEENNQKRLDEAKKKRDKDAEDKRKAHEQEVADLIKFYDDIKKADEERVKANSQLLEDRDSKRKILLKEQLLNDEITQTEFQARLTEIQLKGLEERLAFQTAHNQDTLATEQAIIDLKLKQKEDEAKKTAEIERSKLAFEKEVQRAELGLIGQFGNVLAQLAGRNKLIAISAIVIQKAAAIGQLAANTAIANAKAVAASPLTFGQPWVGINTASAILSGVSLVAEAAQSISEINSQAGGGPGFAAGGKVLSGTKIRSGDGRPVSRANGDNLLATVRTGEVILNERHQAALGGDATFRAIGVPGFAGSGITAGNQTRAAVGQAESQSALQRAAKIMMQNMPPIVVTVEDINAKQDEVATTQNRAVVI